MSYCYFKLSEESETEEKNVTVAKKSYDHNSYLYELFEQVDTNYGTKP